MPHHGGTSGRKLSDLLLPGPEFTQIAFAVVEHPVIPTIGVEDVLLISVVEDRELLVGCNRL